VRRVAATGKVPVKAWQVAGSFALTGEDASYRSVTPKHPIDPKGRGFGAVELVARYSKLNVDSAAAYPTFASASKSAREAKEWGVGINWYLERGIKVAVNYSQTKYLGGAAAGNRADEHAILTRFQLAF
jgi:phosphate-selective porin OprO/OprP